MNDTIIKRARNTETQCCKFWAQQTPRGHLSSLRLFVQCFLLLICSSCCCFFWLLPYLLITHWPFWCWTHLSPIANFRCYLPFSDYKVTKCSLLKNTGQEYIWLSIICSHMQLVTPPFSLCIDLIFTHYDLLAQRIEGGRCRCRRKKKTNRKRWIHDFM